MSHDNDTPVVILWDLSASTAPPGYLERVLGQYGAHPRTFEEVTPGDFAATSRAVLLYEVDA